MTACANVGTVGSPGTSVSLSVTGALVHQCPFREEEDRGFVTIGWATRGSTIELHDLRAWLDSFAPKVISHEDLTQTIATQLGRLEGIALGEIVTTWHTAGFTVTCTEIGDPA